MRNQVIQSILTAVGTSAEGVQVIRGLRFLHELNSFPTICVWLTTETRFHYGDGRKFGIMELNLRGYTMLGIDADISETELFGRQIEEALDLFRRNRSIQELRILTVRTDEGLMKPYGTVDMTFEVTYDVE